MNNVVSLQAKLNELGRQTFAADGALPVVHRGSREWNEWRAWYVIHKVSVGFMDTREQWTTPSTFPPDDIDSMIGKSFKPRKKYAD